MRLVFLSENTPGFFYGYTVKSIKNEQPYLFRPQKTSDNQPPLSVEIFKNIPEGKIVLYDIHSLDCCLNSKGEYSFHKISEQEALLLSKSSVIYKNIRHMTPYFRYKDNAGQHTVWFEDTFHQIKKLNLLKSQGVKDVGILINSISSGTVINLIRTQRYCICNTGD